MASPEERVAKFKRHAEALNKQFLEWCTSQIGSKPNRLLGQGISDYIRHAAKLRLEFSDIIGSSEESSEQHGPGFRTYAPLLSLMPLCHTKTVHFIRHGEGWHNVGLANADAHLTPRGWQQAHALGRHMREHVATAGVQLVVVSPLMRTLETAAGVFGEEESGSAGSAGDILMVAQGEAAEVRVAHPAMRQRRGVTYIANELCRERLGPSSCDGRRSRSEAAAAFSGVDFSLIDVDKDPHWRPGNVEPEEAVVLRGRQFLQWLMTLPATNIAVVTHSAFLFFTLSGFGVENVRPVRERLQRWYENCEMRSVVLGDGGTVVGLASPSPTLDADFRGGHAMVEAQKALVEAEGKSMKVNGNGGGGSNGGAK